MLQTRTVQRSDGNSEVIRILSREGMDDWSRTDPLAYEKSIVWMEDVERLPFVRVLTVTAARSRRGPLQCDGPMRVVGYAKLTADAPRNPDGKTYSRRVFYVRDDDLKAHAVPHKALDPRSVLPGVAGYPPAA